MTFDRRFCFLSILFFCSSLLIASCDSGIGNTIEKKLLGKKEDPEEMAKIYNIEGMKYSSAGDYASASRMFTKALSYKENPGYYNNLGRCYYWLGRYEDALKAFSKSEEMGFKQPALYVNIGDLFQQRKENTEAIRYYHKALSLDPKFIRAHYEIGVIYLKSSQYQSAIERMNKVLEIDPGNSKAMLSRLIAYAMLKDYENAYLDLEALDRRGYIVKEGLRETVLGGLKEKRDREYQQKLLH